MRRSSFLFRRTIRLGKTRTPFGENKYPAVFRFGTRSLSVFFGSAGKPETSEHNPIFANKTAGRRSSKPGLGLPISVFIALPEAPDGSMRQISEPSSTTVFRIKESQVEAFRHSGALCIPGIFRILPD